MKWYEVTIKVMTMPTKNQDFYELYFSGTMMFRLPPAIMFIVSLP